MPHLGTSSEFQRGDILIHYSTLHHITSRHATSHHTTPHHITSHHTTSHNTTPHHTTPHHITSHHLWITIDSELSLSSHISQITSICFYNIRQLRLVRRSLTEETSEALVRSFIHSFLDYCSAVLAGQPFTSVSNRCCVRLLGWL